jgi:putative MATE family efflux protein
VLKKLIRQMMTAQIFSALTVSLCLMIDSIIIGQYLGVEAIAAYGLSNPILLVIGAFGSALSAGVQVVCSKSLGRGLKEETNAGFSSAVGLALAFSLPFMLLVLLFRTPLTSLLGADTLSLFDKTREYITGFVIGAPATMGALILVPFLQMAGKTGLLIASVGVMTVTDIALDILNVTVFHGGMFGMGLASSLSYYAALLVGAVYFLSPKCFFSFSVKQISGKKILELFKNSIPAVFNMAASVILVFGMNKLLLASGPSGSEAVAAYSVIMTLGNASCCIYTGIGGVSLTLTGIFYQEEDRTGLKLLLKELAHWSLILGAGVGLLLFLFAPAAVSLFITERGETWEMAVLGLRIFMLGLIPCCLNGTVKNAFQSSGRESYTEMMSILHCAVFPLLAAFLLTRPRALRISGAWFFFVCGELMMLAVLCLYVRVKTGRKAWQGLNVMMLPDDFSVSEENMLELEIKNMEDVEAASEEAMRFCMERGQDRRVGNRVAVCVEEMASNVVQHGFSADSKEHHLSIRLMHKRGQWILRFRDDCGAFDPINYVPAEAESDALGIRLVLALADDIRYTYSMSLNNLMIVFKDSTIASLQAKAQKTEA